MSSNATPQASPGPNPAPEIPRSLNPTPTQLTPAPDAAPVVPAEKPPRPLVVRALLAVLRFLLSIWMLLAMGLVVLLAWLFPSVGKNGGHIAAQWTVGWGAIIIIFLVSGLSLPFSELLKHARDLRLHLVVQTMSFLVTSSIFFAIACAAHTNKSIETSTLVGLIATGCLPTTIASNVVMTRSAGGDIAATMVEVSLGNFLGPFISPLLFAKLYLPAVKDFAAWLPREATNDLPGLYRHVMFQMGLTVFVPLFAGQALRAVFTKQVTWAINKFKLPKLGSLCLIALIWSTFCNAFASGSLQTINTPTIVFNVFVNLALCIFFTLMSLFLARPPMVLHNFAPRVFYRMEKRAAISVLFCAPAKTQGLGIPLVAAMYASADVKTRALIQVPVILYTAEQIMVGQALIALCQRWLKKDAQVSSDPEQALTATSYPLNEQVSQAETRHTDELDLVPSRAFGDGSIDTRVDSSYAKQEDYKEAR